MEADNIDGKKEPKRLPVWACISLFIVVLFIFIGLYGTLVSGGLSLVLGVEARHPGVVGYIFVEASMLLAVLTAAVILLRLERRPFSDLGLSLKGHASGLWYGLLMAILLYLLGFGISVVLGEIEVTGFQFKPLDLLGSWVFFLLVALFEEILMRGYILGRLLHTNMNKFLALFQFRITVFGHLNDLAAQTGKEITFDAKKPSMSGCTPKQAPKDITPAFIRRHDTIRNHEGYRTNVVSDQTNGNILVRIFFIGTSGQTAHFFTKSL